MKSGFLDKLIERLDRLDAGSLQTQFLRLAKEKGFLETIFHAIHEGIMVVDGAGRVTYANRAAEKVLGISLETLVGGPAQRVLRGIEWEQLLRLDEQEWSRLISREIEITYPEHRLLNMYVVPLAVVKTGESGAVIILRDITREREHEAQAIESEKLGALMLLAAGVAHEIGNPLNSLNIHLQLIERELGDLPPKARESLGDLVAVARKEVARLDQIITQFLRAIRPQPLRLERAAPAEVLRETLDFLKHEIKDRDILVETEIAADVPPILLDRGQIRQAFFNIIRNAIQAMPNGGLLKIGLAAADPFVLISFRDTGPGIAPERMGALFEPYQTTKPDGSGLGLMIVQRIVRDHGGRIEVQSEPRLGTTITLMLPIDEHRIRLLKARTGTRSGTSREDAT